MSLNLHEICRLCLEEIKTPSATLKEGSNLLTKIRRFLPLVKIMPGDGLPTLVCQQCVSLVNICYNFKLQVEQSDLALQKYCASHEGPPVTQPFIVRKDDMSAVDPSDMNVAGSSYQDAIAGSVGVHLLAPLGIDKVSPDDKYAKPNSVTFSDSEQQCLSCDHEKHYEDRQNSRLMSDNEVQHCGYIRDCKPNSFLGMCRTKTRLKEKPYICAYCGQPFRYMSSLTRHLVIHSGEKRYVCQICNKAFTQEAHLKTHSILHTGEKPFHCNMCPMSFSRKGNLKRHLQVHKESK